MFICPVMSGFDSVVYQQVKDQIEEKLGEPVSSYALMAYDSLQADLPGEGP